MKNLNLVTITNVPKYIRLTSYGKGDTYIRIPSN